MTAIHCTLVGFRHHAWQGTLLAQRLAKAPGSRVVLMRDSENHRNAEAAVACVGAEVVAYVTNDECHRIAAYLDDTEYGLLYGNITQVNVSDQRCTASIEVERPVDVAPAPGDGSFDEWDSQWADLPLVRMGDADLQMLMLERDILSMLHQSTAATAPLISELDKYLQQTPLDISGEATVCRRQIADLLGASPDDTLRAYGQRLEVTITAMGSNEACERTARHISDECPRSARFQAMAQRHHTVSRELLAQALDAFPHHLHREYTLSIPDFVSIAYYLRVPRHALRRFVSCELLLEALTRQADSPGDRQRMRHAVAEYVRRIDSCATPLWQSHIVGLWQTLITALADRLARLNGAKDTLFNARLVCMVIGRLIERGVYDATVTQAEYGRRLALGSRDMRSSVNRALTGDEHLRSLVDHLVDQVHA